MFRLEFNHFTHINIRKKLNSSSTRNEEQEDHPEKTEKGTKVKRKLSSLRNRMAGSFNKDKVNEQKVEKVQTDVHVLAKRNNL